MPRFSACRFHRFVLGGANLTLAWLLLLALTSPGTTSAGDASRVSTISPSATVPRPTALAFTPDGRLLVTGKRGRPSSSIRRTPTSRWRWICRTSPASMSSAVSSAWRSIPTSRATTTSTSTTRSRSPGPATGTRRDSGQPRLRFVLSDADVVNPGSETVLVDNIPSPDGIHNAGDLGFGPTATCMRASATAAATSGGTAAATW